MTVLLDVPLNPFKLADLNPLISPVVSTSYDAKVGPRTVLKVQGFSAPAQYLMLCEGIEDDDPGTDDSTLAHRAYASKLQGPWTIDDGAVVSGAETWKNSEFAPTSCFVDGPQLIMFAHGGNNSGTGSPPSKHEGISRCADLAAQTWVDEATNPVYGPGGSSAWDEKDRTDWDIKPDPAGPTKYRGLFRGRAVGESHGRTGLVYGDDLLSLTFYASNPVIPYGGGGAWDENGVYGAAWYRDSVSGRIHAWYVGDDAGVKGIGYAYSDDNGQSFTKSGSNPLANQESESPAFSGDVLDVFDAGDCLFLTYGVGQMFTEEGVAAIVIPNIVESPTVPARWYHTGTRAYTSFASAGGYLLNRAEFSIVARLRAFRLDRNDQRHIYTEKDAFNQEVYLRIEGGGGASAGQLAMYFRTPTAIVNLLGSANDVDTSQWMRILARRIDTDSFEIYVRNETEEGSWVLVDSDNVTDPGTTTAAPDMAVGNWHPDTGNPDQPFKGTISHVKLIDTSLSTAEADALIDSESLPGGAAELQDLFDDGTDTGDVFVVDASIKAPVTLSKGGGSAAVSGMSPLLLEGLVG